MQLISSCFTLLFVSKSETMWGQLLSADNASLLQGMSAAKAAVKGYHSSQTREMGKVPTTTISHASPL